MGRIAIALVLAVLVAGCAVGPSNRAEMFPARNADSAVGLFINEGTVDFNLWIYDQANRLVEEIYFAGGSWYTVNGRHRPNIVVRMLPIGQYRVEYIPFYYRVQALGLFRDRVDLPRGSASFTVGRDPYAVYYEGRHWGWVLRMNGGTAPLPAPTPRLHFSCNWPIICQ